MPKSTPRPARRPRWSLILPLFGLAVFWIVTAIVFAHLIIPSDGRDIEASAPAGAPSPPGPNAKV